MTDKIWRVRAVEVWSIGRAGSKLDMGGSTRTYSVSAMIAVGFEGIKFRFSIESWISKNETMLVGRLECSKGEERFKWDSPVKSGKLAQALASSAGKNCEPSRRQKIGMAHVPDHMIDESAA